MPDFGSSELILKRQTKTPLNFPRPRDVFKININKINQLYTQTTTTDNSSPESLKDRAISEVVEPYAGLTTDFHSLLYDNLAEITYDEKGDRKGLAFNNSVQLWYLVRMLDRKGSGWVDIELDRAAATLKRGKATVKRHIKQGREKGFFRDAYKIAPGRWRIYYASLFKVAAIAGLDNWGATVEITEADLPRLKLLATEMTAKALQASSRYLAGRQHKRVPTVKQILNTSLCCRGVKGKKIRRSNRFVSVTEDMPTFGASQAKVASKLNRSRQTVCRRLSNNARVKIGLPSIARRQILKQSDTAHRMAGLGMVRTQRVRFFRGRDRTFVSLPNVYSFDLTEQEINMTRKQRKNLKKQVAIASSEHTPDRHLKSKRLARYFYRRQRTLVEEAPPQNPI